MFGKKLKINRNHWMNFNIVKILFLAMINYNKLVNISNLKNKIYNWLKTKGLNKKIINKY
jgi:hypothetical protein